MSIVTISRGSFSRGKHVAEKLAKELGYECISREILLKASKDFNIPEVQLLQAIQDAPSVFDRFKFGKKKYVAFIREAFLEHIQNDNIVYHGFAGHFFTKDIPNILKVRIIADLEFRIDRVMKNENVTKDEARKLLTGIDEERRKWSQHLYGIDTHATELYDLVLRIDCLSVDEVVDTLIKIVNRSCFQTTPESKKKIKDMLLAAKVYSALVANYPDANVKSNDGKVLVTLEAAMSVEREISGKVKRLLENVEGIKEIKTYVIPFDY